MATVAAHNRLPQKYHWHDGADNMPVLTFVDHTGPAWPVHAAADEWDFAGRIDVDYRVDTCNSKPHCVGVSVIPGNNDPVIGDDTCSSHGGYFLPIFNQAGTHYDDDSFVRFNHKCGNDNFGDRDRRALACEEEGHAVGLDHADSSLRNETCMASGNINTLHHKPRSHDFGMADNEIYNHND